MIHALAAIAHSHIACCPVRALHRCCPHIAHWLRCVLVGNDGRCTNGHARGLTVARLLDPTENIRVGGLILRDAGHRLRGYNAGRGYADRIAVLAAALERRALETRQPRMVALRDRIIAALESRA